MLQSSDSDAHPIAPPAPSSIPSVTADVSRVTVRSSKSRRQMETRLRLRRQLLRMKDTTIREDSDSDDVNSHADRGARTHHSRMRLSAQKRRVSPKDAVDGEDEDDDEGDDEDDGEDCEDDEAEDGDDEASGPAVASDGVPKPKSEKCELASVVKLLFSKSDPVGRPPTVWFDYPPHLQVTRELPSMADDRVVSVNATDCELYFKTHWERNCVKNAFAVAGLRRTKKRWTGWHIAWAKHMSRDKFKHLHDNQVYSHLPDPWVVGRKDRLMKTLTSYKRRFGAPYAFFPEGFSVPDQLDAFKRATQAASPSSLWILKPPASACGRGIRVLSTRDVDAFLSNKVNKNNKYVLQRYVANPLLVDGFKFDLRIYVLVTSVDPLRIYMFEEGLTRFCTTPYSLGNTKNRYAHLTNYTINKKNNNFVENTNAASDNTGSKWSMSALFAHLQERGIVKDVEALRCQIKDVICKTLIAAEAHLTPLMHQFVKPRTQNIKCYELFGFDLMLDDTCSPWLVEVNVSPSLMAGSPLDKRVKGLLLSDIFHLVGVPVTRDQLPRDVIPIAFHAQPNDVSSPPGPRVSTINKQLHELVLDPKVPMLENKHIDLMTATDWSMIHDMEDEMERLGHFERIFPCQTAEETARFTQFFTCPRYSNALCAKWIETKRTKNKQAAAPVQTRKPRRDSASAAVASVRATSKSTGGSSRRLVAQTASR